MLRTEAWQLWQDSSSFVVFLACGSDCNCGWIKYICVLFYGYWIHSLGFIRRAHHILHHLLKVSGSLSSTKVLLPTICMLCRGYFLAETLTVNNTTTDRLLPQIDGKWRAPEVGIRDTNRLKSWLYYGIVIPIVHPLPLTVQPHHTILLQSQWLLRRSSEVAQAALSLSHVLPEGSISMIRFNFRTLRNNIPRLILLRV